MMTLPKPKHQCSFCKNMTEQLNPLNDPKKPYHCGCFKKVNKNEQ